MFKSLLYVKITNVSKQVPIKLPVAKLFWHGEILLLDLIILIYIKLKESYLYHSKWCAHGDTPFHRDCNGSKYSTSMGDHHQSVDIGTDQGVDIALNIVDIGTD